MIDEKITNTLKELELGLKNIESARKQELTHMMNLMVQLKSTFPCSAF